MRTILSFLVLVGAVANVQAQSAAGAAPSSEAASPSTEAGPANAESDKAPKRAWTIVPRVTVMETITDNVAPGMGRKVSDEVTQISPGVRIDGHMARLKMFLDYQINGQFYAQGSRGAQSQNALNSFGTLEAIEKLFYLDFSGIVTQQTVSAFGTQSAANYTINANSAETSNFRLSPYLKGKLAGYADYEARYGHTEVRTQSTLRSTTKIDEWSGHLGGETPLAAIGWGADVDQQEYDYGQDRKTKSDKWRGALSYLVNTELKLRISAGRESNDFVANKQSWNTSGYGFEWTPTPRTQIAGFRENRFFGHGHTVSISHSWPSSAIKYVDARDVAALPTQLTATRLTNLQVVEQLVCPMHGVTDPAACTILAYSYLAFFGYPPDALSNVVAGFLSNQITVLRNQSLTYVVQGARNVITLMAMRTQNDRLGTGLGAGDDFSIASSVIQQGWNIGWVHQLSAISSLNVMGTHSRSTAAPITQQTTQKMLSAGVTTKLGARTSGALTARRTVIDSTTNPYTENAVVGTISVQF